MDKKISANKDKIVGWLKKPENLALVGIILLASLLRIYFFWITRNQALWWDEAEYASKAVSIATGVPCSTSLVRELVMPLIWAGLYLIYPGELLWRIGQLIMSITFVILTYFTAKAIFEKRIALAASFFMAVNMLLLFYTGRLLLYMWGGFLFTLTVWMFWEGYVNKKGVKWIYGSAVTLSVGTLIYYSTFLAGILIFLFLILTYRIKLLKKPILIKPFLLGSGILISYFIFSYIKWGFIHPRFYQASSDLVKRASNFSKWTGQLPLFPHLFGWFGIILLILGIFVSLRILFILDVILIKKNSTKKDRGLFFVLLWFFFVMFFYAFMAVRANTAIYEGFILPAFPAIAMLCGIGLVKSYDHLKEYSKPVAVLIVGIVILFSITSFSPSLDYSLKGNLRYALAVTYNSMYGFDELKTAGLWLKKNTDPEDKIFSYSHPQITYYSQRTTTHCKRHFKCNNPDVEVKENTFKKILLNNNISYVVLSPYDSPPRWLFDFPQKNKDFLKPVYVVPSARNPRQPMVIIYKILTNSSNG